MADNVNITAGTGTVVGTDQVGTAHYQKIKLASGEADSSVMVHATTDNELLVRDNDANTDLDTIAGAVSGSEMQVDIVSGAVTANLGTTDASNLTDIKTAVEGTLIVDATGQGDVPVTLDSEAVVLGAGTAEIGSVALTSTDSDHLAAIETAVEGTLTISGAVTLPSTDTINLEAIKTAVEGTLTVDATGQGDVPVTLDSEAVVLGAGTAEVGSVALTSTDSDNIATIAGAVSGSEVQVDVVASLPAGTNNIGDVDILTIAAGDNNIGNVDLASAIPAGTNEMGSVALTSTDSGYLNTMNVSLNNIETSNANIYTKTDTIAGAVSGSEMQVDLVGSVPAGTAEIGSVALTSTDSDNLATVAGAVSGSEMQVDVVASLPAGTNAIGKLAANSGVDIGDVDVTSISAGNNIIGKVGMPDDCVTITPLVAGTTDAYASGDVLFDTTEIPNAVRTAGDSLILQSVHVVDKEDQSEEFDLVFLSSTDTIGTVNSAVSISDASALKTLGAVKVESTNYFDLVNSQIATVPGIGLEMESTGTSLYVAGVTRGTPTYTSTDSLQITLGFLRN
jgi:hypothetical protein